VHIVAETTLSSSPDQRSLPLCSKKGGALLTSALYKLCTTGGDAHVEFIWVCKAPSRVKFFAWLLVKGCVQCHANLLRKGILDRASGSCPICVAPLETSGHIKFGCPFARRFWATVGAPASPELAPSVFSSCPLPASAPPGMASTLCLLCFWHLWKHRNGVVFNGLSPSLFVLLKNCRDDATLWRAPLPSDQRVDVDLWLTYLVPERP
jgi:hypothetical protein